ncbi:hypothetical protein FKW77_001728 [Venturia effusa]|uniref:Uncharacterized protein n=1 Tax=Venturia effusa TaxID=50376 RepID=A0A517LI54_9PEZI|nr:hypothetical protein FKW77_001728 [Venturia effusa]
MPQKRHVILDESIEKLDLSAAYPSSQHAARQLLEKLMKTSYWCQTQRRPSPLSSMVTELEEGAGRDHVGINHYEKRLLALFDLDTRKQGREKMEENPREAIKAITLGEELNGPKYSVAIEQIDDEEMSVSLVREKMIIPSKVSRIAATMQSRNRS